MNCREAEGLGSLEVDDELELGRLLNRQIARLPLLPGRLKATPGATAALTIGIVVVGRLTENEVGSESRQTIVLSIDRGLAPREALARGRLTGKPTTPSDRNPFSQENA
jgi:hypothetical protein